MANCTEDGNLRSTLNQTLKLSAGIAVFFSSLNIILAITATLSNVLILIALRKVSSIHPPTKLLFRCLAVTDLSVGLISQPLLSTIMLNDVTMKMNLQSLSHIVHMNYALSFISCAVSIFTSTAISVDRLFALMMGLRYRHVVTLTRLRAFIICFWLIGIFLALIKHLVSFRISLTLALVLGSLSLAVSIFSYSKIFLRLRQQQAQVQDNCHQGKGNGGGVPFNIPRYKKTVCSIAWIQLALVICFVPFPLVAMLRTYACNTNNIHIAWHAVIILLYFNSSINPFFFWWKIGEVKQAVNDTVRQFCCL